MSIVERKAVLKSMRLCRFCLSEQEPLTSIYDKDAGKNSIPLPLQIMACVSIEVFANDGMPQLICKICRLQASRSYKFKTNCKQSDDALKLYLATGNLKKPDKTIGEILELADEPQDPLALTAEELLEPPIKRTKISQSSVIVSTPTQNFTINEHGEVEQTFEKTEEGEVLTGDYLEEEEDEEAVEDGSLENQELQNIQDETAAEEERYEEIQYEDEDEGEGDDEIETENENSQDQKPIQIEPNVPTNVYPCDQCERSFPLQQLLEIHKRNHTRERKFQCKHCMKLFFSKYDLAKHTSVHSGVKPYECVACQKTFARPTLLHRHEKIHNDVPKYLCSTCDRTFLIKEELERHEQVHKKIRPFSCNLCDKSFAFKQGLERHQEIHRADKPHKCNYCEQSFDTPVKLARHVTTHAGIRPYPCKFCHRTFLLSHHLTRHMRGHYYQDQNISTYNYNYKCSECTMQFKRKDGLIGHSTIHSMVSLRCIFCTKKFDDLKLVREHVKSHMYGRIYPCQGCNYSFITIKHLEDHEKNSCTNYNAEKDFSTAENFESPNNTNNEKINLFTDPDNALNEEEQSQENSQNELKTDESYVRRSSRVSKIKDYAQFIKDELGSESEDNKQQSADEQEDSQINTNIKEPKKNSEESIKPIVKPDGTKTYSSRGIKRPLVTPTKTEIINENVISQENVQLENTSTPIDLPTQKWRKGDVMEMKIGERVVKVQKVLMTKAEVEEMARQGKLKMKGGTMLLKQSAKRLLFDATKLPSPIQKSTATESTSKLLENDADTDNNIQNSSEKELEDPKKIRIREVRTYTSRKSNIKIKEDPSIDDSSIDKEQS